MIEEAKSREIRSRGRIDQRRLSGWIDAERTYQPQIHDMVECLDPVGGDLPHRRSTDSDNKAHRPRGRRSGQLQIGRGRRSHWVAQCSTLSCSSGLGIVVGNFARLRDEVPSCGCCDDYGTATERDEVELDVADAAGYDRHRKRSTCWMGMF